MTCWHSPVLVWHALFGDVSAMQLNCNALHACCFCKRQNQLLMKNRISAAKGLCQELNTTPCNDTTNHAVPSNIFFSSLDHFRSPCTDRIRKQPVCTHATVLKLLASLIRDSRSKVMTEQHLDMPLQQPAAVHRVRTCDQAGAEHRAC